MLMQWPAVSHSALVVPVLLASVLLMSCRSTRQLQTSSMNFQRELAHVINDTLFLPLSVWNGFAIPTAIDYPEDGNSHVSVPLNRSVPGSSVTPVVPIVRHTTINTHDRQSAQTTTKHEVQRNPRSSKRLSSYWLVVCFALVLVIAIVFGSSSRQRR